jgi:hypothetical protein
MRVWSIHPGYLDTQGLSGQWREALLAQKVLQGGTKGWRNHPQLNRFKEHPEPLDAISYYLLKIHEESVRRSYRINKTKILNPNADPSKIEITRGQIDYEYRTLMERLERRSPEKYSENIEKRKGDVDPHPLFVVVEGDIEPWETGYWKQVRS